MLPLKRYMLPHKLWTFMVWMQCSPSLVQPQIFVQSLPLVGNTIIKKSSNDTIEEHVQEVQPKGKTQKSLDTKLRTNFKTLGTNWKHELQSINAMRCGANLESFSSKSSTFKFLEWLSTMKSKQYSSMVHKISKRYYVTSTKSKSISSIFWDYVKVVHLKSKQLVMNSARIIKLSLLLWKSQTRQTHSYPKVIANTRI